MLKLRTLLCPSDKERLHFEVLGMMRIKQKNEAGIYIYNARCPECKKHFEVQAPREKS